MSQPSTEPSVVETLPVLFERIARERADAVALYDEAPDGSVRSVSYRELNELANRVAHQLLALGLCAEQPVAVHLRRGTALLAALLGVLKAGGVYAPIDASQPPLQVEQILVNSGARIVIGERALLADVHFDAQLLAFDELDPSLPTYDIGFVLSPTRRALLLHTSGSTGKPKGVLHREAQLLNRFRFMWRHYPFAEGDVACQRTPLTFQPSLWELLGGLLCGVPTVILPDLTVRDPRRFAERIAAHRITHATIVPSLLRMLLRAAPGELLTSLKWVIAAGEPLDTELVWALRASAPGTEILCDYGSTETNGILYFDTRGYHQGELPGFRPIDEVRCFVVDEAQRALPDGEIGELAVAGVCLAEGYWQLPELSAQKFIDGPAQLPDVPRLYLTGDFARWDEQGTLRLEGRRDDQVKIRGNRVNLRAVESVLRALPGVGECAVLTEQQEERATLRAFVVAQEGATLSADQVREAMLAEVPTYMVPARVQVVSSLPRLENGKLDRVRLSAPTPNQGLLDSLRATAAEILGSQELLGDELRFYALGFDSESIARFAAALQSQGHPVTVSDLYNHASLGALAEHLRHASAQPAGSDLPAFEPLADLPSNFGHAGAVPPTAATSYDLPVWTNEVPTALPPSPLGEPSVERVRALAAAVLGANAEELDPDLKFYALGFDSESIARLQLALAQAGLTVSVSELYSHASLRELAAFLGEQGAPAPRHASARMLAEVAAEVLGARADELDPTLKLYALGFDSESLTRFVEALRRRGYSLEVRDAYDHATLESLSEFLAGTPARASDTVAPRVQEGDGAIAIVAASGRFPGANDLDELWTLLQEGGDAVRPLPAERWQGEADRPQASGGFLDDIDRFEPSFFDLSPREASKMDPQQRLALEECWRVLESGGYTPRALSGRRVGVFLGARQGDYADVAGERGTAISGFGLLGSDQAILAARVAYWLNLQGPALTLDTACSSSLVALHLAAQSVRSGECELAIAGGVHVMCTSHLYRASGALGMLSPRGRCRPFDASADGIVPSEAVAMVLLKPLARALAEGDRVLGVLRASGMNQDGHTNGITAPSGLAQQRLISRVYQENGVDPRSISYVEAHGTGTKQGDPIEVSALTAAFRERTADEGFCQLGSIKANLGHPVTAAGVAGLIKVLLAFEHGVIPGVPHFERANPDLGLAGSPFKVAREATPWSSGGSPRRAALSSFGFSGTNCHVVIEEPPELASRERADEPRLFPLSAKSEQSLRANARALASWLRGHRASLADVAYTLQAHRAPFAERMAVLASERAELIALLEAGVQGLATQRVWGEGALRSEAEAFVRGERGDWSCSAARSEGRLVALPTYRFARERFWPVVTPEPAREPKNHFRFPASHPLIRDHRVGGQSVVAGAVLLECVRAAAEADGLRATGLTDVTFLRPVLANGEASLRVELEGERFRVVDDAGQLCCDGRVQRTPWQPQRPPAAQPTQRWSAEETYARLAGQELAYGPSYHVLTVLEAGAGVARAELIAEPISLFANGVLLPSVVDGVLQASTGLQGEGAAELRFPAAIRALCWTGPLPTRGRVIARAGGDLWLLDEAGEVVLELLGLQRRAPRRAPQRTDLALLDWGFAPSAGSAGVTPREVWLTSFGASALDVEALQRGLEARGMRGQRFDASARLPSGTPDAVIALLPTDADELTLGISLTELAQRLAQDASTPRRLLLASAQPEHALGAWARAINRETRRLQVCVLSGGGVRDVLDELMRAVEPGAELRIGAQGREVRALMPSSARGGASLRQRGVYLISGGLGGVGYALAQQLADRYGARLALCGRSPADEAKLAALRAAGAEVFYQVCDVADASAVRALVAAVRARFGALHGVLHAAGVLADRALAAKRAEDFELVYAPKVAGARALDAALSGQPLDFFVLFSSVAAVLGNAGQCDYALANGALDALAEARNVRVRRGQDHGHTLSIAWPLWDTNGMQLSCAAEEYFKREFGLRAMSVQEGFTALEQALASAGTQLVVCAGDQAKFSEALAPKLAPVPARPAANAVAALEQCLRELATEVSGSELSKLTLTRDLREYGFESMMLAELIGKVNARLGVALPSSVLFDHPTLASFAAYLSAEHAVAVKSAFADSEPSAPAAPANAPAAAREPSEPLAPIVERSSAREPIAVIGMAARLPGAGDDLERFLAQLERGEVTVGELPLGRCEHPNRAGERPRGAFLDDVASFDARFFAISAHEASLMDPQQRLLLELAWATLEHAGVPATALRRRAVGAFVGAFAQDYRDWLHEHADPDDPLLLAASDHALLANRLSFAFDWQGPSEAVDTACSSSLVALHRALAALHGGECELALVAGVHLLLSPRGFQPARAAGMLSKRDRATPFDASADGYLRGEGAGALLLKPLSAAQRDGDTIYALIRGSAVRHGGRGYALTAPNGQAQVQVLLDALASARLPAHELDYIEAHGTGSAVSDGIELRALAQALSQLGKTEPTRVGSLKGNIGHLEGASGIAALIKVILCLRHGAVPKVAGFERLHPDHQASSALLRVCAHSERVALRYASVHSFGLAGTAAHVVLEKGPEPRTTSSRGEYLFVFSAKTQAALERTIACTLSALAEPSAPSLHDAAYTLQRGREAFDVRVAVRASSLPELRARIDALLSGRAARGSYASWLPAAELVDPELADGDLDALGASWVTGAELDWARLLPGQTGNKVALPSYGFERVRHWLAPRVVGSVKIEAPVRLLDVATRATPRSLLSALLGQDLSEGDGALSLSELGFDSLLAVKLQREAELAGFGKLPMDRIAGCSNVGELLRRIAENGAGAAPLDERALATLRARLMRGELAIDALSEELVDRLLVHVAE